MTDGNFTGREGNGNLPAIMLCLVKDKNGLSVVLTGYRHYSMPLIFSAQLRRPVAHSTAGSFWVLLFGKMKPYNDGCGWRQPEMDRH